MMETGSDCAKPIFSNVTPGAATYSEGSKLESRLSILALLAPSSPSVSPPPETLGYRVPTASHTPGPYTDTHTLVSQQQQHDDPAGTKAARFQALLPRPSEQRPLARVPPSKASQPGVAVPRRVATIVACENCRAKRTKCDGARPKCSRCARLGTECQYDAGPDETRSLARKRKFEEMKSDLTDLQELYEYLRERPLAEVAEVIRRIRSDADPCKVLRLVREGDLLLQASAIGRKGIEAADVEHIVDKLDDAAYRQSSIKVSAKQWTDVAGDGLVSELVSIFFDMEQPFATTYVDRHCFLEDMASEQIGSARFCSPALVNAICAIGAFTSKTAKEIDRLRGGCIRSRFYEEAKKQLDLEHGKVSLPTVMALYSLFLYSSEAGIDRAGAFYRVSCSEMYKKMRLGSEFPSWVDKPGPKQEQYRRAVSRASWGLFCMESISSFVYIQPALIPPPTLPRIFDDNREDRPADADEAYDVILDAECSVSRFLYEIMCYNLRTQDNLGQEDDIRTRLSYYVKLLEWEAPRRGARGQGLHGLCQSLFIESYFSIAVIALFRPLAPLNTVLPDGSYPASLVVEHCQRMGERMREMKVAYPDEYTDGCVGTLYFFYVCGISLVALLDREPRSHEPFVETCRYFSLVAGNFPVGPALLRGMQALALETGVALPRECESFFSKAKLANENFRDVPVSYVIPQAAVSSSSRSGESEASAAGLELGNLIEKWSSSMSM